jgi:hypothetical protein
MALEGKIDEVYGLDQRKVLVAMLRYNLILKTFTDKNYLYSQPEHDF